MDPFAVLLNRNYVAEPRSRETSHYSLQTHRQPVWKPLP